MRVKSRKKTIQKSKKRCHSRKSKRYHSRKSKRYHSRKSKRYHSRKPKSKRKPRRKFRTNGKGPFDLRHFNILSKFLLPDGTIGGKEYGKNIVKIQINNHTEHFLYLYTSQTTGGFWRIYIPNFLKLEANACKGKYGHYITTTFVDLYLQNSINTQFDKLNYEQGLPNCHESNVEISTELSNNAIKYMNETSYPEEQLKEVLCNAITDYSALNGISKSSYIISPSLKNFLKTSFENPIHPYLKSIQDTEQINDYNNMYKQITQLWMFTNKNGLEFSMPIKDRVDIKSGMLLQLDKRVESMKLLLEYINLIILKNFNLVGNGSIPFTFLRQEYYIDIIIDNFIYYEDFQSKEYPEQLFRLYSVKYETIGPVNILLIPLIDGNPSGLNMFGGYNITVDPGLWVYKIADYIKQYPLYIDPLSDGANIGLTYYPKLPFNI